MEEELTLREIQNNSFKVLLKLKEIFDNNGWKYYLAYGTLIGAIRHNDFIPWDDDIDIWVPRDDYEKFIIYCKEHREELKPFELIHYTNNDKYIYPIARFSDSTYKIDYFNVKNYGLGLFVDLYPLDGIDPKDTNLERKIWSLRSRLDRTTSVKFISTGSFIKDIFKFQLYLFSKLFNPIKILKRIDIASQKYAFKDYEYIDVVMWTNRRIYFEKKWFGTGTKVLFHGVQMNVPLNYDRILREIYGDYMKLPPIEQQIAHHNYLAYKRTD